ncbi:ABC transporter permease subunit [Labedella endophytica]|uniref:ABC transporter permease n=1 Tax=Labedella endophytica TaxID=1523160 RepID=A0A3S0V8W8_9MICO|nr:ABC transporter permease subunit [Labedella endophytica]RUQ98304.1 ABC transporter permease [Labedella endophytica]
MTAPALTRLPAAPRVTTHPATFGRLVTGEWVKFRSLRSSWAILALGVVLVPAFAVSRMTSIAQVPEAAGSASLVASVYVTSGTALTQLVFAVFGVMAIAGEYGSGQIRTTLAVTPGRIAAIGAKLLVTVLAAMGASIVAVAISWAASAPWFAATGMSIDLTNADDLRILAGVPLYLGAITALAFGVGLIVRSSAAGIAIVLGFLLVLENLLGVIPWEPIQAFAAYLPSSAGSRLLQSDAVGSVITTSNLTLLSPWAGYGVMVAWVVDILVVAFVLLRRRDA